MSSLYRRSSADYAPERVSCGRIILATVCDWPSGTMALGDHSIGVSAPAPTPIGVGVLAPGLFPARSILSEQRATVGVWRARGPIGVEKAGRPAIIYEANFTATIPPTIWVQGRAAMVFRPPPVRNLPGARQRPLTGSSCRKNPAAN